MRTVATATETGGIENETETVVTETVTEIAIANADDQDHQTIAVGGIAVEKAM